MDNFAIAIAAGCTRGKITGRRVLQISVCFALAHIIMFSSGWLGGQELGRVIDKWDHWVACGVLAFIGGKMIYEALSETQSSDSSWTQSYGLIGWFALATSLDALGVGIAISLENAPFWWTLWLMAGCVFVTSFVGFELGRSLGERFGVRMEILGGLVLVGFAIKILLSGLGIW